MSLTLYYVDAIMFCLIESMGYVRDIEELRPLYLYKSRFRICKILLLLGINSLVTFTYFESLHTMETIEFDRSSDLWSIVWQTFENASLTYDHVSSGNGTRVYNIDGNGLIENPTMLGIITGLFFAWLADIHIIPSKFDHSIETIMRSLIFMVLNASCFALLAPVIAIIITCFFIYRQIVHVILKISIGKNYAGLLDGTDCVWAVEDSSALSVINVLAILEVSDGKSQSASSEVDVLEGFRNLVKYRLTSSDFEKLFWIREKNYGYYYWRKSEYINLEERVRWLNNDGDNNDDDQHTECDGTCGDISGEDLKKIIAKVCNRPLPQNHSLNWEILVVKTCPKSEIDNDPMRRRIPLLFRVHHALGDGVALLRLLLEAIADTINSNQYQNQGCSSLFMNQEVQGNQRAEIENCGINELDNIIMRLPILQKSSSLHGCYRESSDIIYYSMDLLGASMPFPKMISIQVIFEFLRKSLGEFWRRIFAFVSIPSCLFRQALQSMDSSALHGPQLIGEKIICSWMEDDYKTAGDYGLLEKIRDIKNVTGTRFADVVLAALSANLNNYFLQKGNLPPKMLTVVIPARMTTPSQKLLLKNGFSVGLLPLRISEVNGKCDNDFSNDPSKILDRLRDVSASSDELRSDPDYLVNFWVMKWLCAALPEYFVKPFLHSNSTMVFSNLPGPQTVAILGHKLKKVAFWIPHRGKTGIGFSFLSYGGSVSFSVTADKAVMNDDNALNEILKGTIHDIEELHKNITLPCSEM